MNNFRRSMFGLDDKAKGDATGEPKADRARSMFGLKRKRAETQATGTPQEDERLRNMFGFRQQDKPASGFSSVASPAPRIGNLWKDQ